MACEKYCVCEYCTYNNDCPYYHYGDGSAYCGKFECEYEECKRKECISYEELQEDY